MLDISEAIAEYNKVLPKREDRFCLCGEDDGKGCIILRKDYIFNPKRKSRPLKIPVREFLATAIHFVDGIYEAHYLPPEKRESEAVYKRRKKRLQKFLKEHPIVEEVEIREYDYEYEDEEDF